MTEYGSTLTMKSKAECALECALSVNMSCDSFIYDENQCSLLSITNSTGIELIHRASKRIMPDNSNFQFYVSKFASKFVIGILLSLIILKLILDHDWMRLIMNDFVQKWNLVSSNNILSNASVCPSSGTIIVMEKSKLTFLTLNCGRILTAFLFWTILQISTQL